MNLRDDLRCLWSTVGVDSMRCMCPASLSTSRFCIFHRHADEVDCAGIVAWSQEATAEEYVKRATAFASRHESPHAKALRERLDAHRAWRATGARSAPPARIPGEDALEDAA